jgi:type VI secretion system protein ImpK
LQLPHQAIRSSSSHWFGFVSVETHRVAASSGGEWATHEAPRRQGELALALQEAFTVAVRLRTRRQVSPDAQSFRAHVKRLLAASDGQARDAGYDPADVRLAIYAFIAFLDESVLNSGQTMFAEWPRQPLQEEVFGDHVAGENFFRNLRELMGRPDSESVADVLEVYELALLLGFRGRFASDPAGLQAVLHTVHDKIRRIRGGPSSLSPGWSPAENEVVPTVRDSWLRAFLVAIAVAAVLAIGIYLLSRVSLGSSLEQLDGLYSSRPS